MDLPQAPAFLARAREFADSKGITCYPVSAKTGENVTEAFTAIGRSLYRYLAGRKVFSFFIVGDRRVGKKNLFYRFCNQEFREAYEPAPGNISREGWQLRATVYSGPEGIEAIAKGNDQPISILLVYDLANPESFSHIQQWMTAVRNFVRRSGQKDVRMFVVGNKCDLISEATGVSVPKIASRRGDLPFIDVSAKRGDNLKILLEALMSAPTKAPADDPKKRRSK
jgi:GTPase SAR1 family protein